MTEMFYNNKKFDQDISEWNVDKVEYYAGIFSKCNMQEHNKPDKFKIVNYGQIYYY